MFNQIGAFKARLTVRLATLCLAIMASTGCANLSQLSGLYDSFAGASAPIPTPTPRPPLIIDPQIEIAPESGSVGDSITVTGSGWVPGQLVTLSMEDLQGRSGILAATQANADGAFTTGFIYPAGPRWSSNREQTIVAFVPEGELTAQSTFTLDTAVDLVVALEKLDSDDTSLPAAASNIVESELRPRQQGYFLAFPASNVNLDGDISLWPPRWSPINAIVHGRENLTDGSDLYGEFQPLWTSEGIFLAIRVWDEQYRSGPAGTDMWQGDSIEIQFDRALADDFEIEDANDDDYQIGVSFGPGLSEMRGYRWLPLAKEGPLQIEGNVRAVGPGYHVEMFLPWSLFDVDPASVAPNATFGFAVSVNDNDGATPAQQSMISTSPFRSNHRTPTQWGTLIIQP